MMRSLFSGVSGLRTHQVRMDVIGHNIANVNTVGFKSARMTFADAIAQRIAPASSDNPATQRAGRNPQQIGLGTNIGGIDNIMTQGAAQRTDRPLDLAIQGEGFFIVGDERGKFFTRAGNVDWNGRTFSIGGMQLFGWPAIEDPGRPGQFIIQQGAVAPLQTPPEVRFMEPTATSLIEVLGNMNINDRIVTDDDDPNHNSMIRPIQFYDTIGNRWTADVRFTWFPPDDHEHAFGAGSVLNAGIYSTNAYSLWAFEIIRNDAGLVPIWPHGLPRTDANMRVVDMNFSDTPADDVNNHFRMYAAFHPLGGSIISVGHDLSDVTDFGTPNRSGIYMNFTIDPASSLAPPAVIGGWNPPGPSIMPGPPIGENEGTIRLCWLGSRAMQGMNTDVRVAFADGNAPGRLMDIMIGPDGVITGRYSNGETRPLGQIPLAMFMNPAGLERVGNNLWIESANSGRFDGVGNHGNMMPGTLEMSNVDLSNEFTEMITTQRGFQANSRIISVSDEMLQELVNLRR